MDNDKSGKSRVPSVDEYDYETEWPKGDIQVPGDWLDKYDYETEPGWPDEPETEQVAMRRAGARRPIECDRIVTMQSVLREGPGGDLIDRSMT
jgi:hypothetical protein